MLRNRLYASHDGLARSGSALDAIGKMRTAFVGGSRLPMPSTQRERLINESPRVSEVTVDERHRPDSMNFTKHFTKLSKIISRRRVQLHDFLPVRPSLGFAALLAIIDAQTRLSLFTPEGTVVLEDFDLGHTTGSQVTMMSVSRSPDMPRIMTGTRQGVVHVHSLKFGESLGQSHLDATISLLGTYALSNDQETGEVGELTSLLLAETGHRFRVVLGDSLGSITVFSEGDQWRRQRVTRDLSGVTGLLHTSREVRTQTVIFFSSHSVGVFNTEKGEVDGPLCSGWHASLTSVGAEFVGLSYRLSLALSDGDVLSVDMQRGKRKSCEMRGKLPHLSRRSMQIYCFSRQVFALETPPYFDASASGASIAPNGSLVRAIGAESWSERPTWKSSDLFLFSLDVIEKGVFAGPSPTVALQVTFTHRVPTSFALHGFADDQVSKRYSKSQRHVAFSFNDDLGHHINVYAFEID
eukprot:TRINITY_DN34210_c0_g1_i1.p1 TRINITY_DN34210_c0_g1~~TRINITY_DN34210_c0_g1_i1.p1  ORF type:complete len:501 (-),score=52.45 TRINITY_DN34210_c0_g1_i1:56-1456(-)